MQIAYSVIQEALQKKIDTGTIDYLYPSDSSRSLLNDVCLFLPQGSGNLVIHLSIKIHFIFKGLKDTWKS